MGFFDKTQNILDRLRQVREKAPEADQAILRWGESQVQAKMAEEARMRSSSLQQNLVVVVDYARMEQAVGSASNDAEFKQRLVEQVIKPILKEAYIWEDVSIVWRYVPHLKANLHKLLFDQGYAQLITPMFTACADWGDRSAQFYTEQDQMKEKQLWVEIHREFAKAMRSA